MMGRWLPLDYSLRNLGRRPLRTILTGSSCALVAALLVVTTSFVTGLERSWTGNAPKDTVFLLSSAAQRDVVRSAISPAVSELVSADVQGVTRVNGIPLSSPEIHMGTNVRLGSAPEKGAEDPEYQGFVRGVTERAYLLHDAVTIIEGRAAAAGEVMIGQLVAAKMGLKDGALGVGDILRIEGGEFTVAGLFVAPGTTIESEIWVPLYELMGLMQRDDVSTVLVRVDSEEAFEDLLIFASRRLDLELEVIPAATYYKEAAALFGPIRGLAWVMALMIAAAALFSGANTLNSAVQERRRELAALRAVGYPGRALARSLCEESLLLASAGGLAGLLIAKVFVGGTAVSLAMSAFSLEVDALAITAGFLGSLVLGAVGTIPAALRVLRLPIAAALKED